MARYSKASQGMKLENGDIITVEGVKAKVLSVEVIRSKAGTSVLLVADFSRGKEAPSILNYSDVDAIRFNDGWVDVTGNAVNAA